MKQTSYDMVAKELAANVIKPGLWARAIADCGSNDERAKAYYIRLRAEEIETEWKEAAAIDARRKRKESLVDGAAFVWNALHTLFLVLLLIAVVVGGIWAIWNK